MKPSRAANPIPVTAFSILVLSHLSEPLASLRLLSLALVAFAA